MTETRPIIVTEMLTLDGVMEAPGGGDHPRAGWTFQEVEFVPEAGPSPRRGSSTATTC